MLKIKDDVDLKELEKMGFKPKYDEDTGELCEYFWVYEKKSYLKIFNIFGINIRLNKIESEPKRIKIKHIFKEVYKSKVWVVDNYKYNCTDLDKIYDLIQAGLIEKVGDIE